MGMWLDRENVEARRSWGTRNEPPQVCPSKRGGHAGRFSRPRRSIDMVRRSADGNELPRQGARYMGLPPLDAWRPRTLVGGSGLGFSRTRWTCRRAARLFNFLESHCRLLSQMLSRAAFAEGYHRLCHWYHWHIGLPPEREHTGRPVGTAAVHGSRADRGPSRWQKPRVLALIAVYIATFRDYGQYLAPGEVGDRRGAGCEPAAST